MKLYFSFFIFTLFLQAKASMIEISFHENESAKAKDIFNILVKKFFIPKNLILTQIIEGPCRVHKNRIVHLCINKATELELLWMDKKRFDYTLAHMIEFPPLKIVENSNENLAFEVLKSFTFELDSITN